MKKIITGTLLASVLFTSGVFADDLTVTKFSTTSIDPTIIVETIAVDEVKNPNKDLIRKYELVIRNNNIEMDYKYNSNHYYTSKMKSEDLIVPKEIMEQAEKVYFLVEEGSNRIFYANDAMNEKLGHTVEEVKKEYNYRIVEYKAGQDEYIFDNKDLVKDFGEGEYKNVTITLMAEFSDVEKVPLSNTSYLSMNTKINVLTNLKNNEDTNEYYGYYNSQELEEYLEKISEKYSRANYKKLLEKAEKKIESAVKANEKSKEKILSSITREPDFSKYVSKYALSTENDRLLSLLSRAVKNQLQNIRAFDAIDAIFR